MDSRFTKNLERVAMLYRTLKLLLKSVLPMNFYLSLKGLKEGLKERIKIRSLRQALKQQGLSELYDRLIAIVQDIRHQYTTFEVNTAYLEVNVRAIHAFQISLVEQALRLLCVDPTQELTVVDVGDSAGTHIQYLRGLYKNLRSLSVNLDKQAVDKIRQKGLEALHVRAEEVDRYAINPDIFLLFETLEHLSDPIRFLRSLASVSTCRAFIVTVPYVAQSRVGLHYIRNGVQAVVSPEKVHIFELSPSDWRLIFQHTGWKILDDRIYWQYPKFRPLHIMKKFWRTTDFEGFYGAILVRDDIWSRLYQESG